MSDTSFRTHLSHVGLHVRDMPKMQHFYAEVLGLQVRDKGVSRNSGMEFVFMRGDETVHHHLALISGGSEVTGSSRLHHMAFRLGSLSELRAVRDRAIAAGAADVRAVNHGISWVIYFSDPEGNLLEAFLEAPFHVPQPRGLPLDLDQSDAEVWAETERVFQGDAGFATR